MAKSIMANYPATLSTPINRTAKQVVSKGVHFERKQRSEHNKYWETPPSTDPFKPVYTACRGARKGRLVVAGYIRDKKKGSYFLVRCDCSIYERRKAALFLRPTKINYCQFCDRMRLAQWEKLSDEQKQQPLEIDVDFCVLENGVRVENYQDYLEKTGQS